MKEYSVEESATIKKETIFWWPILTRVISRFLIQVFSDLQFRILFKWQRKLFHLQVCSIYLKHEDLWEVMNGEEKDVQKQLKAKSKQMLMVDSISNTIFKIQILKTISGKKLLIHLKILDWRKNWGCQNSDYNRIRKLRKRRRIYEKNNGPPYTSSRMFISQFPKSVLKMCFTSRTSRKIQTYGDGKRSGIPIKADAINMKLIHKECDFSVMGHQNNFNTIWCAYVF